ncbi:hypothetical protein SO694_00004266 [Aureococcus anophagefferens]|uniref:Uncharacterized protein n=1 Tax=Aureococcus anophagefferens TaxID=44056 RepID=A0ABR1G8S9_AURAN
MPVASYDDYTVAWYENDGSQLFTERVLTTLAGEAYSVFAIDVDGDGDVDVLSADWTEERVAWYEHYCATAAPTVTPTVTPRPTTQCDRFPFLERVVADTADGAENAIGSSPTGDGDVDVLSANYNDDAVAWYENDSQSFTERVITNAMNGAYYVFAIDVDGDGDVGFTGDTVAWYENDGSQSFGEHIIATLTEYGDPMEVYAIDVDGDGDVDALSAAFYYDMVAWYENDGSQSFTERVITTAADGVYSAFAIDVDSDGDVDALSTSENDDTVAWYENDGSESFDEKIISSERDGQSVFAVDVDGDGDVDVLAAAWTDVVAWYENDCATAGTYSYAAASASCLACPYPLVATTSAAAYCGGAAGTRWSDDWHAAFLESNSHEDGAQCAACCRACPDGSACDELGHTAEAIAVEAGYWRGSVASVRGRGVRPPRQLPGGAALGGDDLCDDHSEGIRCNECEAGFYLAGPAARAAACGSSRVKLAALGVGLAAAAAAAYVARPYAARVVPWKKKDWWLTTLLTLWYTAQSNVVFFRIEGLDPPAPFSLVLSALDVVTLEWAKGLVFTPCDLFSYYAKVVAVARPPRSPRRRRSRRRARARSGAATSRTSFPHKPGMRVACCQLFLLFKVFLSAKCRAIVRESHHAISLACCGYLACCVVYAGIALGDTTPSRLQEQVFSVALRRRVRRRRPALARSASTSERFYGAVAAVQNLEPFDAAAFRDACGSAASALVLRRTVYHAAVGIVRAGGAHAAYLKSHLQPLDVVWADALPHAMLLGAHGDDASFAAAVARHRAASGRGAPLSRTS